MAEEWQIGTFSKDAIQGNGSRKKGGTLWVVEMFEIPSEQMSILVSPSTYLASFDFSYCCEWVILVKLPLWSLVAGGQFGLAVKVWWKLIFQEKHGQDDSGLSSLLAVADWWLYPITCSVTLPGVDFCIVCLEMLFFLENRNNYYSFYLLLFFSDGFQVRKRTRICYSKWYLVI